MVSPRYQSQFPLTMTIGDDIYYNSRSVCHMLGKSHQVFKQQAKTMRIELVCNPLTITRLNGNKFQSENYVLTERQMILYLVAFDRLVGVKLIKELLIFDIDEIQLSDFLCL